MVQALSPWAQGSDPMSRGQPSGCCIPLYTLCSVCAQTLHSVYSGIQHPWGCTMIPGLDPGARGLASPGQLHKGLNDRIGVYSPCTSLYRPVLG